MSTCLSTFVSVPRRDDIQEAAEAAVGRLLIIDAHPGSLIRLSREAFSTETLRIESTRNACDALQQITENPPNVILLDPQLPDRCGLDLYREIRQIAPLIPVIFVSGLPVSDAVINALKLGAFDYLFKPLEEEQFKRVLGEALDLALQTRITPTNVLSTRREPEIGGSLCGVSKVMREVYKSIALVAAQNVNVLITGESGTGKELVARAIHQHSSRSDLPFLAINCAAIPENLLESELFGHEKGAFSGADRRRIGKFEQCNGGTILLDEIGDMPLALQAKILRLLQEQTFERVGGNETIRTNVRLIASTHRDLKARSAEGEFRADLYYRLSVFAIHLPALRERGEDLPILVRNFLAQFSRELGRDLHEIAPDAMDRLMRYHWPGNIRELQSVLKQAILRSAGRILLPTFLPNLSEVPEQATSIKPSVSSGFDIDVFLRERLTPDASDLYADLHREIDRHYLARVLTYTRGNQFVASRVLGIARQTLRSKLRESGLYVKHSLECTTGNECFQRAAP
jgi:two-component system, NtrC family, response regulator AtoC